MGVEFPSVIAALDLLAVKATVGERHAAMGAGIAQGESFAVSIPADYERGFEQHDFVQSVTGEFAAGNSAVPESVEHKRVRSLALGWFEFRHLSCSLL